MRTKGPPSDHKPELPSANQLVLRLGVSFGPPCNPSSKSGILTMKGEVMNIDPGKGTSSHLGALGPLVVRLLLRIHAAVLCFPFGSHS